jgi:hypothetical protein
MDGLLRQAMRMVERMGTDEWIIVGVVAMVIGFICMRGFGSRSGY